MAKPIVCGSCGASLVTVLGHHERVDIDGREIVGFLECPHCGASYVYQRPIDRSMISNRHSDPPATQRSLTFD